MGSAHGDQAGSPSHGHSTHESPRSYVSWQAFYHLFQQTLAVNSILQPLFFDPAVIHEARSMNGTTSYDLDITCVVTSRSTEPYRCLARTICIFRQDAAFRGLTVTTFRCLHVLTYTRTRTRTHRHTTNSSTIEQAYSSVETQNSQHDRDEPRGDSGHTSFMLETQEPSLALDPHWLPGAHRWVNNCCLQQSEAPLPQALFSSRQHGHHPLITARTTWGQYSGVLGVSCVNLETIARAPLPARA